MEHLDFIEKINNLGISIRNTKVTGRYKRIEVPTLMGKPNEIIVDGFELSSSGEKKYDDNPLKDLIKIAIDMGEWKHSWHNKIEPENYDKFQQIIQEKILHKAKEIELLLTVYFQLNYEKSKITSTESNNLNQQ